MTNTIDDLTDDQQFAIYRFLKACQRMKISRWQALLAVLIFAVLSYPELILSRDVKHMPFMSYAPAIMQWLALACCGLCLAACWICRCCRFNTSEA